MKKVMYLATMVVMLLKSVIWTLIRIGRGRIVPANRCKGGSSRGGKISQNTEKKRRKEWWYAWWNGIKDNYKINYNEHWWY